MIRNGNYAESPGYRSSAYCSIKFFEIKILPVRWNLSLPVYSMYPPQNDRIKQLIGGDRRKALNRRIYQDRRKLSDRRTASDRRTGWGKLENQLLEGARAATASLVYQFSRPFTIILGYVDLLASRTGENYSKEKLAVIKTQLQVIAKILDSFREIDEFKTMDFDGIDILDTNIEPDHEHQTKDRNIL